MILMQSIFAAGYSTLEHEFLCGIVKNTIWVGLHYLVVGHVLDAARFFEVPDEHVSLESWAESRDHVHAVGREAVALHLLHRQRALLAADRVEETEWAVFGAVVKENIDDEIGNDESTYVVTTWL